MTSSSVPAPSGAVSPSRRVREHILEFINNGMAPHQKLPTERELAEQLEVSRLTVRRVLSALAAENIIYRIQGSGTYVRPRRITKDLELTSFSEDMRSRGLVPGSINIEVTEQAADAELAAALELTPGSAVISVRRVRTADGERMCIERADLPAQLVPGLSVEDLKASLYEVLHQRYGITIDHAKTTFTATVANPADAAQLGVPPYSAVFKVTRTAFDIRGRAFEHAVSMYRGDRYSYEFTAQAATTQKFSG